MKVPFSDFRIDAFGEITGKKAVDLSGGCSGNVPKICISKSISSIIKYSKTFRYYCMRRILKNQIKTVEVLQTLL